MPLSNTAIMKVVERDLSPAEPHLDRAIDTTPDDQLRGVLKELCKSHPEFKEVLFEGLMVVETKTRIESVKCRAALRTIDGNAGESQLRILKRKIEGSGDDSDGDEDDVDGGVVLEEETRERKRIKLAAVGLKPRFEQCTQCNASFEVMSNHREACVWHDDILDVDWDSDFWADHDECHGPVDTKANRNSYPEGFIWSCCDRIGNDPGCKTTRHRAPEDPEPQSDEESTVASSVSSGTPSIVDLLSDEEEETDEQEEEGEEDGEDEEESQEEI